MTTITTIKADKTSVSLISNENHSLILYATMLKMKKIIVSLLIMIMTMKTKTEMKMKTMTIVRMTFQYFLMNDS